MSVSDNLLKEALTLKPQEKAELIDKLILSLDKPDKEIEALWAKEIEDRIEAYEKKKMKAVPLEEVLKKYK